MLNGAQIDNLRERLVHARLCSEAWWLMEGRHSDRENIIQALNPYAAFFETVRPALFSTFVNKTATLFDTDKESISLRMLPHAEDDDAFSELFERGRRLYKYRSKVIAHADMNKGKRDFGKETELTNNSLRKIIHDACELFNRCAKKDQFPECPDLSCSDDFLALVYDLNSKSA